MKNVKTGHAKPIVCLDAGHYGKYNRSPVVPAYYESDMNWKLHRMLKEELEKYPIQVRTTRADKDKDLDLVPRGNTSSGCDLFLSLHSNAADTESAKYVVAMYQVDDNCGDIDAQSKAVAAILAKTVGETMDLPYQTWSTKSSKDRDGNGYKDDYYGVLRGAHSVGTAGVIVEHGFHTHTATAQWLLQDSNLRKLAEAEAKAIADWFGVSKLPKKTPTVTVTLPVIYPYDKNEHVEAMQALLIGYGYSCGPEGVDGSCGGATQKALKQYQQDSELDVDGKCGPATWGSLLRQK